MIAIIENEYLRSARDETRHTQGKSIRIGGGKSELPIWKFEATLKFLADPNHIFIRKHERDTFLDLLGDGFDGGFGRVACHCARVTEAEINVIISIHIGEVRAFGFFGKYWKRPRPADHPQHRHTAMQ